MGGNVNMKVQIKLIPKDDEQYVNQIAGKIMMWLKKHNKSFQAEKSPVRHYISILTEFKKTI